MIHIENLNTAFFSSTTVRNSICITTTTMPARSMPIMVMPIISKPFNKPLKLNIASGHRSRIPSLPDPPTYQNYILPPVAYSASAPHNCELVFGIHPSSEMSLSSQSFSLDRGRLSRCPISISTIEIPRRPSSPESPQRVLIREDAISFVTLPSQCNSLPRGRQISRQRAMLRIVAYFR